MRVNSKATFYLYDPDTKVYTRSVLDVWWEETKSISYFNNGIEDKADLLILVPITKDTPEITLKSRVVQGEITQEITSDYTITNLIQEYDVKNVMIANPLQNGTQRMWHWEVGAK